MPRVGLALHIHDAELSFLYHRDSLLKHRRSENETLETSLAFNATTAREWEASLRTREDIRFNGSDSHHSTPVDSFAVYLKLEALGVLIAEDRRQGCLKTTSFLYHRDSLLKHRRSENETLETSLAFNATTAREWEASLRTREDIRFNGSDSHHSTPVDSFAVYLKLEALGVLIAEDRRQGCLKTTSKSYEDKLLRWHKSFYQNNPADQDDELCLLPLWHWTFINLLVDVDKIESAIGRDGPERGFQALEYITNWAATKDAARCMMHAFLLQRRLEALKLDHTPALHVPRIAFSAAIVSYCFITYGPGNDPLNGASNLINTTHPEFRILGEHVKELTYLSRLTWNRTATSSVTAATLCVLNGLLEMMGVWGLAGRFAKIIARLIDGEA